MKVWGGISSCQTTLTGLLTHAWHGRQVPLTNIARLTSANVTRILGVESKGEIAPGKDADFAIVDLDKSYVLQSKDLFYKHPVTPYIGDTFQGSVEQTILRGTTIFKNGKITAEPMGRLIRPKR